MRRLCGGRRCFRRHSIGIRIVPTAPVVGRVRLPAVGALRWCVRGFGASGRLVGAGALQTPGLCSAAPLRVLPFLTPEALCRRLFLLKRLHRDF